MLKLSFLPPCSKLATYLLQILHPRHDIWFMFHVHKLFTTLHPHFKFLPYLERILTQTPFGNLPLQTLFTLSQKLTFIPLLAWFLVFKDENGDVSEHLLTWFFKFSVEISKVSKNACLVSKIGT